MSKKDKDTTQKPPSPGPAPSAEEMRRRHVETVGRDRLQQEANSLAELLKGNLKKSESLRALELVGVKIIEIALQTRGRLRSSDGRGDAFLEATAANVRTAFRHADKVMEDHDKEMGAWAEALEIAGPALEDLKRVSKGLERPGVKIAIVPGGGDGLFDDEGQPTEKAAAPAAPKAEPKPEPAKVPAARPVQTLGMTEAPVIDVEPEPSAPHALDGLDVDAAHEAFDLLLEKLEEDGVEEGLKRKDWNKAWDKWTDLVNWDADLATIRKGYDLLRFAMEVRKPFSWALPTEKEFNDHQRQLAIAAGE